MFRSTARRLAAVAAVAAAAIAIAVLSTSASATQPHHTLYRNFCPLTPADLAAAGPYSASTHSAEMSSRP